ncbi:MAG: hypothetical protein ABSE27_09890 [Acidobacteriaceae bacterium]|jgi:hypothetical protein
MTKIDGPSLHATEQLSHAAKPRLAKCIGTAILLLTAGVAAAQTQPPAEAVQDGYTVHQTADLGGHMVGLSGSGAMYDTLVNIQSGPRVLGETFTMHAVEGTKHPLLDDLTAFSSGFGGDPNNFAKLDFSKGKLYEFSGMFRRDRQYSDYDLLANPDNSGLTVPYGVVNTVPTAAALTWPQNNDSPVMFNTVRRMTDTNLTVLPLSKVSFRAGYSQNIFQGPTLSPARSVGKYDSLVMEVQRNSTDDFTGAIDWKPVQHTKVTFEEQVTHYKADSYFTLNPNGFLAQEADGTPVSLGDWDALASPYSISACNTASMGSAYSGSGSTLTYTIFSAPQTPGGLPIVNPACDVITSYLRSQPTRSITPTEMLRLQSSSIRNIAMNGDIRFTMADTNLPNYYENWTGLDGTIRSATFTGNAQAKRQVLGIDYGLTWQATKTFALSEQIDFSNAHQPGISNISTGVTQNTLTNPNETINYSGALVSGAAYSITGNPNGTPLPAYFGQSFLTNNVTGSWDATPRATVALTYRVSQHVIAQGFPHNVKLVSGSSGTVTINENGAIFNAALRPTNHWDLNGTIEAFYDDNVFTPMGARQTRHYRIHTLYRPKPWATLSGAFNDLERHNNTNNTDTPPADGPLQHVDHSRTVGLGAVLAPNERYGFDFNYSYSDVYISTNACYLNGATAALPGAASTTSAGAPNLCPNLLTDWGPVKDFMDAPTQYASFGVTYSPNKVLRSGLGYRISAVSGNQFFSDAQQVNGSLQSAYQSPYLNLAWTVHPGLVWRAEYNFYGYGEGGPSGAPFCSTSTTATSAVVPCNSSTLTGPTGLTEPSSGLSAPRNFHANNLTLAIHYEF